LRRFNSFDAPLDSEGCVGDVASEAWGVAGAVMAEVVYPGANASTSHSKNNA